MKNLPTVNKVLSRLCHNDGITYQSSELIQYEQGIAYLKSHKNGFADSIVVCLKERVKLNNPGILNDAVILLFTQRWQRSQGVDFADTALRSTITHFTVPLQNAHIDVFLVEEEWKDMVGFAKQYLNIVEEDYPTIWWKLFNSAYSKKWKNILSLVELIVCLPMSNGHVECAFSSLKLVKTNLRNKLSENHLDDLLRIAVDSPPLSQWDASGAIQLWWKDRQRFPEQARPFAKRTRTVTEILVPDPNFPKISVQPDHFYR